MIIEQALKNMKSDLEGVAHQTNHIRGGSLIDYIHEAVKHRVQEELQENGITNTEIKPPTREHQKGEIALAGLYKRKTQDIAIAPNIQETEEPINFTDISNKNKDQFGFKFTEKTLSINVRSQQKDISANKDTIFERLLGEALNLHLRCPKMVLGDVFVLSLYDYSLNKYIHKDKRRKDPTYNTGIVEEFISFFQSISNRNNTNSFYAIDNYVVRSPEKYEATSLLIVDFRPEMPKLYNSTKELIDDGFLPQNTNVEYEGLEWDSFFDKILDIYNQRFGLQNLQHL